MDSVIWKVRSERIATLEPFSSEYDMESFLMNNPAIVGCWNPSKGVGVSTLIRKQLHIIKGSGSGGRIDLVGFLIDDIINELRIFELKVDEIDMNAVSQLKDYIDGWGNKNNSKTAKEIKDWIISLKLDDIDNKIVKEIINNPQGILVGSRFNDEVIQEAKNHKLQGIKLTRFKADSESEYYVIIEDQFGEVIKNSKKQFIGWKPFIESGLITESDVFFLRDNPYIKFNPDIEPEHLNSNHKWVIFQDQTIQEILKIKEVIINRVEQSKRKWFDDVINSIDKREGIRISKAGELVNIVFELDISFWVPGYIWIHEKKNQTLAQLTNELKM